MVERYFGSLSFNISAIEKEKQSAFLALCKFGFVDVMSSAWMEHNVHGSLLTVAQLCEQTHSAIARMSEGAAVANGHCKEKYSTKYQWEI